MNGIVHDIDVSVERKLDGKGRLSIPNVLREATGIAADSEVIITVACLESGRGQKPVFIISKKEG